MGSGKLFLMMTNKFTLKKCTLNVSHVQLYMCRRIPIIIQMGKKRTNKDGYIWIVVNIISVFNPRAKFCLLVLTMTLNHKVGVFDLSKYLKYMYIWLNNSTLWGHGRWPHSGRCHIFRISYFHLFSFWLNTFSMFFALNFRLTVYRK